MTVRFTAVIPTLDEAGEIGETLSRARAALGQDAELIVVDGGSTDGTLDRVGSAARVVHTRPGRGVQLAAGVEHASGDVVVLLHADTWLPLEAGRAIQAAVAGGVSVGCLTLGFRDAPAWPYRWLAGAINARTRLFRTATGDQAIFATRETLDAVGGIPRVPIFEDVRFVRAARTGRRFARLSPIARTSPRRWRDRGFARTVVLHLWLRVQHSLGASPERLAERYRSPHEGGGS